VTLPDSASADMLDQLVLLAHGLQAGGIPTALTEVMDAATTLSAVDLLDRGVLRECLRATLVKRPDDTGLFNLLFDRYFPITHLATSPSTDNEVAPAESAAGPHSTDGHNASSDLLRRLTDAIRDGDLDALRSLAAGLVDDYSGLDDGASTERYHLYRVMRAADLGRLLADAAR
jgi:uncharacterized protein with von Willebrand factor type A (vWA) domain